MLMPKRVKWRKQMRGRIRGKALRGAEVSFGEYGLQALEPGWVTARQIEAAAHAPAPAIAGVHLVEVVPADLALEEVVLGAFEPGRHRVAADDSRWKNGQWRRHSCLS